MALCWLQWLTFFGSWVIPVFLSMRYRGYCPFRVHLQHCNQLNSVSYSALVTPSHSSESKLNQSQSPLVCHVENVSSYGKNVMSHSTISQLKYRGKAETFSYSTEWTCGSLVNNIDHVILDVILNGLYDTDIRREVLGITAILNKR